MNDKNNYTCSDCLWFNICSGEENICKEFNPPWDFYIDDECFRNRRNWFEEMDYGDDEYVEKTDEWDLITRRGVSERKQSSSNSFN